MRKVDPNAVLLRSLQISFKNPRQYNAPAALSLWDIDDHHKLIRCVSSKTLFLFFGQSKNITPLLPITPIKGQSEIFDASKWLYILGWKNQKNENEKKEQAKKVGMSWRSHANR